MVIIFYHKLFQVEKSQKLSQKVILHWITWWLGREIKFFNSKIKLSHGLIFFKESGQVSSVILSCKGSNKNIWNKITRISVFYKNGTIYVWKEKNYVHRKYKDFQFSLLKEWRAWKKRYTVQNINVENISRGLALLYFKGEASSIRRLCETNCCFKI